LLLLHYYSILWEVIPPGRPTPCRHPHLNPTMFVGWAFGIFGMDLRPPWSYLECNGDTVENALASGKGRLSAIPTPTPLKGTR